MLCSAYFGELSNERKENWHCEEREPCEILIFPIPLKYKGHKVLEKGNQYFHDRIQIDWGSFAWKCTQEEILKFLEDNREILPGLVKEEEKMIEYVRKYVSERGEVAYGVVFVEEA